MDKKINSIKVQNSTWSVTIYVNFDNGKFGTHSKDRAEGAKWIDSGLSAEELAEAKRLALKDGKWTNYTAPRKQAVYTGKVENVEDIRDEIEEERKFRQPVTFASMTDANS